MTITIHSLGAREILDSRGNPTVEVQLFLSNGLSVSASVPSGASTGKHEAVELRDGDMARYAGKGVQKAVQNVLTSIAPHLIGQDPTSQAKIDQMLIDLDGTPNKSRLGANAMLAISLAVAKAGALSQQKSLHNYFAQGEKQTMPVPLMNIINGGAHANNGLNIQEFLIVPLGFERFADALRCGAEIFQVLKRILDTRNMSTSVGDEGGFAPDIHSHEGALDLILSAIEEAGYHPGDQVFLALDVASSEFFHEGKYTLSKENLDLDAKAMADYLTALVDKYPIISIEDGMAEEDWSGWQLLTKKLGDRVQLIGDDVFVTNTKILQKGIQEEVGNAILIKPNQIGTLTETFAAVRMAQEAKYGTVISHRSGETEETIIADIAVGLNAQQIKTGSLSRTDRVAKYNQLLRIELANPVSIPYAGLVLRERFKR